MISRVMVWACPEPDCEVFDTQRWENNRASTGCAYANHPEAVHIEVVSLSEIKEALLGEGAEAIARAEYELLQEELGRETVWEEETQGHRNIYLDAARERLGIAFDAAFSCTDSEGQG